jgi:hypothetical protein
MIMHRRQPEVLSKVPFFLITPAIKNGISRFGDDVEGIVVKKISRHYYTISIDTRPVKHELWPRVPGTGGISQ